MRLPQSLQMPQKSPAQYFSPKKTENSPPNLHNTSTVVWSLLKLDRKKKTTFRKSVSIFKTDFFAFVFNEMWHLCSQLLLFLLVWDAFVPSQHSSVRLEMVGTMWIVIYRSESVVGAAYWIEKHEPFEYILFSYIKRDGNPLTSNQNIIFLWKRGTSY